MYLAVDIGGTKTLVAVFDEHGNITEKIKFPTSQDYGQFKIELADNVAKLSTNDFFKVAAGLPGRLNRARGIGISCGNLGWRNVPVQADFEYMFHAPTYIENDAKLAGLYEAHLLGDRFSKVLYLTISTGIGIALIVNGEIDTAIGDRGGRDILLEHKGELQSWESFASGKAIMARYHKPASEIEDPKVWKIIVKDFAVGMIDVIAITEPEVVVIGGGVGSHFDKYGDLLIDHLKRYETPLMSIPTILQAQNPEEAVVYGCYEYAKQHHEKRIPA